MKLFASLQSRASALFRRSRMESEMDEELREHIQRRAADLERNGLPRDEAERRARIEFGDYQRFKDEIREQAGARRFETVWQDLSFGLRMMRKSPGFTLVAILTLALGIGANTAIFSVVYAALLRPLPYRDAGKLITIGEVRSQESAAGRLATGTWNASYPDFLDWKTQSKAFESIAGFGGDGFTLRGVGEPDNVPAVMCTPNFLGTLGVKPFMGRDFVSGEDTKDGPSVALLTYGFWKSRFGGDPHVVGRSIQLDTNSVRIIGVLPENFEFAPRGSAVLWVPMHIGSDLSERRNLRWMRAVGRLASGVDLEQSRIEMNLINKRLADAHPRENGSVQLVLVPLRDRIVGQVRPLLLILFGAVAFVLLIACANVANLMMARATRRRKEFAVRTALGAGRGRLISQLLAESLMLACAGGALGLFLARFGTGALIAAIPQSLLNTMPFLRDVHANPIVLAFVCGAAILTGLVFGLAPLFEISHERSGATLQEESRGSAGGSRTRLRDALVIVEIAFSMILLIGAGLMLRSLAALLDRDPGFNLKNLVTFSVFLPDQSYPKDPDVLRFDRALTDRLRSVPGFVGVATNSIVPLTGGGNSIRFQVEGQTTAAGQENECNIRNISTGYFSMMGIRLLAGREFNESTDNASAPKHLIVTDSFVKRYFHGENAIGKRLRFTYSPKENYREIVGVVADIADAELDSEAEPALYIPSISSPSSFISYVVRTAGNPASSLGAIRAAVRAIDPQLLLIQPSTLDQVIDQSRSVFLRRYPSYLIGSFAALALVLAMIGLYGLISYSVSQRIRELGIRIALGAKRGDVIKLVVGQGAKLALIGVAAGVLAALALTKLMRSLLYGVGAADPLTFVAVAALLTLVALVACWIPAMRAMRTDPMTALRCE